VNKQDPSDALTCASCSALAKEMQQIQPALSRRQWAIALHNVWSTHASETDKLAWALLTLEASGLHHRVDLDTLIHAIRERLSLNAGVTLVQAGHQPTAEDVAMDVQQTIRWAVRWIRLLRDDLGELSTRLEGRLGE
jgi:hypothetical protein